MFVFLDSLQEESLTIVFLISSECERCIAVLQDSVSLLLHCLETVDTDRSKIDKDGV